MPSPGMTAMRVLFHGAQYIESAMRFAALETSTEWCSVALWRDGEIAARRAARRQPPFRARAADAGESAGKNETQAGELDAVAFGAGPGRVHRPADRLRPRAGARVSRAACR